jgi:gliding motility-associated protein GldM
MAGEKLSARQKMIGMMYLVLTALLALQVSSSVLDKFALINKSLEKSIHIQEKENEARLDHIKTAVRDSGNREKDVVVLNKAMAIRGETVKVIDYLNGLKKELIRLTGGEDATTGRLKGLKDDAVVAKVMCSHKKADELKALLNGYVQYLTQNTGKKYKDIALDAKDSEFFKNDPNQHSKSFAALNFEKTPLGAALATLSQFGTDIIYSEADALDRLAREVGAEDLKFDNISLLVKPKSNIVAAGTKYNAELFLAASSSMVIPFMAIDDKPIPVESGVGKISFLATPGKYEQDGLARKIFKAMVKLKVPGGDSTFVQDIEYFVAKPVIQVQSAAISALYLNAGNELNIQVPALGIDYNPKFTAEGATVVPSKDKGFVTIIPHKAEVKLSVYNNGSLLDTLNLKVRTIPKPDIQITAGAKPIDLKQGIPVPGPRKLEIKAISDESFKNFLPKDARYRVAQWEVTLARGTRSVKSKKVDTQEISLSDFAGLSQPGDRIIIEVKKVERLNFKDEIETVNVGTVVRTIPIT